jgi:hypothetical protein
VRATSAWLSSTIRRVPEGYELEVFAGNGQTIAVVSVPESAVQEATKREVLSVRELTQA